MSKGAGGSGDKRTLLRRCKGCIWAERIGEEMIFCPFPRCVQGKLPTGGSGRGKDDGQQKKTG